MELGELGGMVILNYKKKLRMSEIKVEDLQEKIRNALRL